MQGQRAVRDMEVEAFTRERRVAAMMASHGRLGAASQLSQLPWDVMDAYISNCGASDAEKREAWRARAGGEREGVVQTAGLLDAARRWAGGAAAGAVTEEMMHNMIQQCAVAALSEWSWGVFAAHSRWTGAPLAGRFRVEGNTTGGRTASVGRVIFHVRIAEDATHKGLYTCHCKCERKGPGGASVYGMVSSSSLVVFERLHEWLERYLARVLAYMLSDPDWRAALPEHMRRVEHMRGVEAG